MRELLLKGLSFRKSKVVLFFRIAKYSMIFIFADNNFSLVADHEWTVD